MDFDQRLEALKKNLAEVEAALAQNQRTRERVIGAIAIVQDMKREQDTTTKDDTDDGDSGNKG